MLNTLYGIHISDKYSVKSDRIMWAETVEASNNATVTLTNAINGSYIKDDLASLNYFVTKYTLWTQNGIITVEMKPDSESINKIKTYALTQKTEAPFIPPKLVESDIELKLTNDQAFSDDVFVILDILKINQNKTAELLDFAKTLAVSPDNIDIQTLGTEKYLIYTNKLLIALINQIAQANNVKPNIPAMPPGLEKESDNIYNTSPFSSGSDINYKQPTIKCRRK